MKKVLKFEYTKRARLTNWSECQYAQKVIRRALPYAVEHFRLPWSKIRVRLDALPPQSGTRVTMGWAEILPDGTYFIVINCAKTRFEEDYVNTFGHELTHCEQYFRRRLHYTHKKNVVLWEGKKMLILDDNTESAFSHYLSTPWEVEARENAEVFYQFFRKELKKKSWWGRLLLKLRLHAL